MEEYAVKLVNPLVREISGVLNRVKNYKAKVRNFYFEVILSVCPCPACGGQLRMTGQSECTCSECGNVLDPTLEIQISQPKEPVNCKGFCPPNSSLYESTKTTYTATRKHINDVECALLSRVPLANMSLLGQALDTCPILWYSLYHVSSGTFEIDTSGFVRLILLQHRIELDICF